MMTNPIFFYLEFFHITLKVVYPSLDEAEISPLWFITIFLAMARPNP